MKTKIWAMFYIKDRNDDLGYNIRLFVVSVLTIKTMSMTFDRNSAISRRIGMQPQLQFKTLIVWIELN
jgi:hypothetical protein